jgi:tryptophan 2,3-dioxygenase
MAQLPTYWEYIKVDPLLELQTGLSDDERELTNDEVMFITIHQIDELWFKLILRELISIRDLMASPHVPEQAMASIARGLSRTTLLFRNVTDHFALMETMTTRDYLAFRDKLSPASGFQSAQLREIEIVFGLEEHQRVQLSESLDYLRALRYPDGSESNALHRVLARLQDRPNLRESVDEWLFRTPIHGSSPTDPQDARIVAEFIDDYLQAHADELEESLRASEGLSSDELRNRQQRVERERDYARRFLLADDCDPEARLRRQRIRAALVFIESYRELPLLAWPREVVDNVLALEQAVIIFRQRHARMVERVIGRRTGTGGSSGVNYLDQTAAAYRIFSDVWAVRTVLLRNVRLPPLKNPSFYGFVSDS